MNWKMIILAMLSFNALAEAPTPAGTWFRGVGPFGPKVEAELSKPKKQEAAAGLTVEWLVGKNNDLLQFGLRSDGVLVWRKKPTNPQ